MRWAGCDRGTWPRSRDLYDNTTAVRVAIIGAGLMGAQIGCEYALGGHDVVLHSRDADAAHREGRGRP